MLHEFFDHTGILQAVVLSSAGLLWAAAVPIGKAAVTDNMSVFLLLGSVLVLATRKVESLWVILAAAIIQLAATVSGIVSAV
jgi:chromate transporter